MDCIYCYRECEEKHQKVLNYGGHITLVYGYQCPECKQDYQKRVEYYIVDKPAEIRIYNNLWGWITLDELSKL